MIKSINLCDIRSSRYDSNIERLGEWSNTCIVCGRRTAERDHIQMTTSCILTNDETEVEDSQGLFPIGPECLKKFNKLAKPGMIENKK